MLGRLRAITARFGLINVLLPYVGTFPRITASPLSLENSPQALVIPPKLTYLNDTSGPSLNKGWPDKAPFYVIIKTSDPDDHCQLSFPILSDRLGTAAQNHFFLLEVRKLLTKYEAQPAGSNPKAFDIGRHDVRFTMEPIPQHPAGLDLVTAALKIMSVFVEDSEAREFAALLVCRKLALARFRTWFMSTPDPPTELDWNLALNASSLRKRIF